ncbi:putative dihydrodipicolinate synthase [Teratosphaeria nubilosa]|uniref:Putative dihydrodipicolinate synthase n=1 Tax=Teratosphaeria nubilosa TaxID=161662 RepID=A0A6G1L5Y7_9PEZI|nr:putative dihydrodipicolinate synthase [Teratosphaeria nubilosa]
MSATRRVLKPGLYGPLPTFFDENQDLDLVSFKKHLLNLATKGIGTPSKYATLGSPSSPHPEVSVCAGSLGEAVHLTHDERTHLIRFTRQTLDAADLTSLPIVAGVGGSSTRETIKLAHDAHNAGADAGLVIPPPYYARSLEADDQQIVQYYIDICAASPIPIFLYNFPSNAANLDISTATLTRIIQGAPNLHGVKLTCSTNLSKLRHLTSLPDLHAAARDPKFLFLDGFIADLTPWVRSGGHGTVSGIPNFAPLASIKLWNLLTLPNPSEAEMQEAERIQTIVSRADAVAVPAGIRGMKYVLHKLHGYSPAPRRPLLPPREEEGEKFLAALGELMELEERLRESGEGEGLKVNTQLP